MHTQKKTLKILSLILLLIMSVTTFASCAKTITTKDGFTIKKKVQYVKITKYSGDDTDLEIKSRINDLNIDAIAPNAFNNSKIENLDINLSLYNPETIVFNIFGKAFNNCKELKTVKIKGNLRYPVEILEGAFINCNAITDVEIVGVRNLNPAFNNIKTIKKVKITGYNNVTIIKEDAFRNCVKLEKLEFYNIKSIEKNAFRNCKGLKKIFIPKGCEVDKSAFDNCDIEALYFEDKKGQEEIAYESVKKVIYEASREDAEDKEEIEA